MSVPEQKFLVVEAFNPHVSRRSIEIYRPGLDLMNVEPQITTGDGNCLLRAILKNLEDLKQRGLILVPEGFPSNHTKLRQVVVDRLLENPDFFLEDRFDIWKHSIVPSEDNDQIIVPHGVTREDFMSNLSNRDWLLNARHDGVYLNNFFVHAVVSLMREKGVVRVSDFRPAKVFYMHQIDLQDESSTQLVLYNIEAFDFNRNVREEYAASKKPAASGESRKRKKLDMGDLYLPKEAVSFRSIGGDCDSLVIIHKDVHFTWGQHIENRAEREQKLKSMTPLLQILIEKLMNRELELLVRVRHQNFFGHDEILRITTETTENLSETDPDDADLVVIGKNVRELLGKITLWSRNPGSDGAASIETILDDALSCQKLVQQFVNCSSNDSSSAGSSSGKSPAAPISSSGGVGGSSSMKRKNDVIELDY